ncbi:MAG: carbamoyltransferase [Candidatus Aminicenantes bacterium]|nr:carbamoyltransferase [Candidatus Aminicenantes bacterium]
MLILGISAFYHDSAACLVRDGRILFAAQEERFSRKKHDAEFPEKALAACFATTGVKAADLDFVVFYEKPLLKFDRLFSTFLQFAPRGLKNYLKVVPLWAQNRIFIKDTIKEKIGRPDLPVLFTSHHASHIASAFYPSPFNEAAVLTVDAVGEWDALTLAKAEGPDFEILKRISFPHSLGMLYTAFTYFCGFKVNSGEYKLMGLAPYGEPVYKDKIYDELIDVKDDGSFRLNLKYFSFTTGRTMTGKKFEKLFGLPRRLPETEIRKADMDLAASIQAVLEEILEKIVRTARVLVPSENLCLAGGVALNCVANGKLLKKQIFKNIWIQPAAGDAGGALGAALYVWHKHLKNPRVVAGDGRDGQSGSFLGPSYSVDEIRTFLEENRIPHRELTREDIARRTAELIDAGKVVGFFQGRMEFGPRALGGRSILGDARSTEMQSIMNLKIKFRESFRPFAPSILEENVADYYDFDRPSPYMLLVYNVKEDRRSPEGPEDKNRRGLDKLYLQRSEIPAVTHVDYSARLHTVSADVNPYYYAVIKEFYKRTGCPVVINTSFNVRGEPIVCTPQDAYRCFIRTNMDFLVLETFLIEKRPEDYIQKDTAWMKEFTPD